MSRARQIVGGLGLLIVGASAPLMGFAAAEQYEGRKLYGVFEGDWFALFGLVSAGACVWAAAALLRRS